MSKRKCTTCPLNEEYKFTGRCRIKTCKNHTRMTQHGCLALDHKFAGGERVISDAELLIYKFDGEASSVRNVGVRRKRAYAYVRQFVMFYYFVQYILEVFEEPTPFYYREGVEAALDKALSVKPLNRPNIGFEPWMLPHLVDPEMQKAFLSVRGAGAEQLSMMEVFMLKPKEYEKLKSAVHHMKTHNTLF